MFLKSNVVYEKNNCIDSSYWVLSISTEGRGALFCVTCLQLPSGASWCLWYCSYVDHGWRQRRGTPQAGPRHWRSVKEHEGAKERSLETAATTWRQQCYCTAMQLCSTTPHFSCEGPLFLQLPQPGIALYLGVLEHKPLNQRHCNLDWMTVKKVRRRLK